MSNSYEINHSKENAKKSVHGVNAQISLESMLKQMWYRNYIKEYHKLDEWSKPDKKGYRLYAPFVITFYNDEQWALYSTTSYRSDRMKGNHWDSLLVKKYRGISRCYLIIADPKIDISVSCADAEMADKDIQRILAYEDALDELDGALTTSSLYNMVESIYMKSREHGVREAVAGTNFEERLAELLSNHENLLVWQGDKLAVGMEYPIYAKLLNKWSCPHDILSVTATTDIPALPSGGNPKTDVLAVVKYADGAENRFTISCKNSEGKYVSAHQYSADAFIKALGVTEDSLKEHIRLFQRLGSERKMRELEESLPKIFAEELRPYVHCLCEWVVSGAHGEYSSEDQIADYLFAFDKEYYIMEVFSVDEYIQKMLKESHGQFGTPFKWTYASKSLGKNIQLKMPTFKL